MLIFHILDRHLLLNARAGGILRDEVVMPLDLSYEDVEKV